jgi:hypothetical protein
VPRFPTERGSMEGLLLLPLFLLLSWGCAWITLLLLQKSRGEQSAWVFGMATTHQELPDRARELARRTAGEIPARFDVLAERDCLGWLPFVPRPATSLPAGFQTEIATHCPRRNTVELRGSIPTSVSLLLEGAMKSAPDHDPAPLLFRSRAEVWTPGEDFHGSNLFRQALWQEAMYGAGFGALPLQLLGVPELSSVTGINLGGAAEKVLNEHSGESFSQEEGSE